MEELNRWQVTLLAALAGAGILIAGFLVGRAIGDGDSSSAEGQVPTRIATRQARVEVSTLGATKRIPTLEASPPPAEAESEESTASSPVEAETPAPEAETPSPSPEPGPEVTVAPNG